MKIYHICDYCQQIFEISEVEGVEGNVQVQGICNQCAEELGLIDNSSPQLYEHWYH